MPFLESNEDSSGDLTIASDSHGRISEVRGVALPAGLIYSPVEPNSVNSVSAVAMNAMTAAIQFAKLAQERARAAATNDQ